MKRTLAGFAAAILLPAGIAVAAAAPAAAATPTRTGRRGRARPPRPRCSPRCSATSA